MVGVFLKWPGKGESPLRQADVQAQFLARCGELYPQFKFRGLKRFPPRVRDPFSFVLRVAFGQHEIELDLICAVLNEGYPREIKRLVERITQEAFEGAVPVLVAPYFSPEGQQLCRQAGLGYFDLAGNAGLDTPRVFVQQSGRENPSPRPREMPAPFHGKAERVTRRLLLDVERRWRMRQLAQQADVSLGLASMVTTALQRMGFVNKSRGGLSVFDSGGLLDAWSESYDLRRSTFQTYRSPDYVATLERRLLGLETEGKGRYALTLWSAARHLISREGTANYLALYWMGNGDSLASRLGLNRAFGKTYVFVFHPYDSSVLWESRAVADGLWVVHPLQLYLDLASGDERELELARRVRKALIRF